MATVLFVAYSITPQEPTCSECREPVGDVGNLDGEGWCSDCAERERRAIEREHQCEAADAIGNQNYYGRRER